MDHTGQGLRAVPKNIIACPQCDRWQWLRETGLKPLAVEVITCKNCGSIYHLYRETKTLQSAEND